MEDMTMLLRHQLTKRIEILNSEFGDDLFSTDLEDYLFIGKSINRENMITMMFRDMKNERELEISIKMIE